MYCILQLDSSLHSAELGPNSSLYNPSLSDLAHPDVKSECSISNLSLKVLCETSHLCLCTVLFKAVCSAVSDVSSSFADSMGGPEGSEGNSRCFGTSSTIGVIKI